MVVVWVRRQISFEIVTDDFVFNSAEELVLFLKSLFNADTRKYYATIPVQLLDEARKIRCGGLPILGSIKARMISFFADGTYQIKVKMCNCESCSIGNFIECQNVFVDNIAMDELQQLLDEVNNIPNEIFSIVKPESFVALYRSQNSLELFYLCKILKKSIAEEDLIDIYGHLVQKGFEYFPGFYLEKVVVKISKVLYKQLQKIVYIHPSEILCSVVAVDRDLSLSLEEYQFLCDAI